jgi:1,4-dihydroxy-2-naphthoate octaprenyltransferase
MTLKTWYIATRPWSLVMTFVSTCLAGIMAYRYGSFNTFLFILTMIGLLIAHIASNMANDWYDVKDGVDENAPTSEYRPHPLLFGEISKSAYKRAVYLVYSAGLLISAYLTWVQGFMVLIFTVLGVFFGVFYTAGPLKLKHHALGEISVFLAFGPLMVGGAFFAISGVFSWEPILASTPIGLLISLVLLANNLRDKVFDTKVGITTIATSTSESKGMQYYKALVAATYLSTIILVYFQILSIFALISFLSLKTAYNLVTDFDNGVPLTSDQQTAQLALQFGVLLTLGELIYIANTALVILG